MANKTRYQVTKDQLERVVESMIHEKTMLENTTKPKTGEIEKKKPQSSDAKKHVKGSLPSKMVDAPSVKTVKKHDKTQASEVKKHISTTKSTLTNKAKVMKESEEVEESWVTSAQGAAALDWGTILTVLGSVGAMAMLAWRMAFKGENKETAKKSMMSKSEQELKQDSEQMKKDMK